MGGGINIPLVDLPSGFGFGEDMVGSLNERERDVVCCVGGVLCDVAGLTM